MTKKAICLAIVLSLSLPCFAHPPTDLQLSYDQEKQTLHIKAAHATNNIREHHIRKLLIYKNQEKQTDLTLAKQTTPQELIKDVALKVSSGDTITVKVFSDEGGTREASLVVAEEKTADDDDDKK